MGRERETQGFRNLASRVPQAKMGPRLSLVWELGKKGSGGEDLPSPCLSRILLTSSGLSRVGRGPWVRAGRPHLPVPQL